MKNKLILIFLIILIVKRDVAEAHRRVRIRCIHDIIRIKEDRYIKFRDCKFDNRRAHDGYNDCEYKLGVVEDKALFGGNYNEAEFVSEEVESESDKTVQNFETFKKIKEKKETK